MDSAQIVNLGIGAIVTIGAITMGLKRFTGFFGSEKKTNGCIKPSVKTGGALHISEEGLGRIKDVEDELKADFRPKEHQDTICDGAIAGLKLYIKEEMDANAEKIIAAVKG